MSLLESEVSELLAVLEDTSSVSTVSSRFNSALGFPDSRSAFFLEIVATREDFRSLGGVGAVGESVFIRGTLIFPANANLSSR